MVGEVKKQEMRQRGSKHPDHMGRGKDLALTVTAGV
jgi:hypothetical protein